MELAQMWVFYIPGAFKLPGLGGENFFDLIPMVDLEYKQFNTKQNSHAEELIKDIF